MYSEFKDFPRPTKIMIIALICSILMYIAQFSYFDRIFPIENAQKDAQIERLETEIKEVKSTIAELQG